MKCDAAHARCPFPCSYALHQSSKGEDRLVLDCRGQSALWAVFDGHITQSVAGLSQREFPELVWSSAWWPDSPGEALRDALLKCNERARQEKLLGGSTAVAVVASGATICCASLGDSRAVAGLRGGAFLRLSVDHVTTSEEEAQRVQALGGRLEWGRLGGLPMTRGLGNFNLEADGFTCDPDVREVPRREVEFVVLASDGLWDVLSEEHCCHLVRDWGPAGVHGDMAKELAESARRMGSPADIAVVVAYCPPEGIGSTSIGGS
jgi:serine/threonine protein phosphatase PrpC